MFKLRQIFDKLPFTVHFSLFSDEGIIACEKEHFKEAKKVFLNYFF
jgi:hypothetical protein